MLKKSFKVLKRYLGIVYLISIFLTVTHHHNDLNIHNDCKICILQSDITNSDTPPTYTSLVDIENIYEVVVVDTDTTYIQEIQNLLRQRAPPYSL